MNARSAAQPHSAKPFAVQDVAVPVVQAVPSLDCRIEHKAPQKSDDDKTETKTKAKRGCGKRTLISYAAGLAIRLFCHSWACGRCAPKMAKQWSRKVMDVPLARFITLTVQPSRFESRLHAEKELYSMFGKLVKRIRRRFGEFEYFGVVEWTKQDWPHFHLVTRGGRFIPQPWLSSVWSDVGAGIVADIRKVEHKGGAAYYILKYLTKAGLRHDLPPHFRRVRSSRGFFEGVEIPQLAPTADDWLMNKAPIEEVAKALREEGRIVEVKRDGDLLKFTATPEAVEIARAAKAAGREESARRKARRAAIAEAVKTARDEDEDLGACVLALV